ncbi:MAG: Alcohol dehydrogenase GroES domain protein [Myxococcales bacterium]|nr:Alcohol dehydrogenase GroES domain protein [Myxococcales bacterium]
MNPADVVVAVAGAALGVDVQAEVAGTVVEAGEAAKEWLGRRVVVPRILSCGDCAACRRGRVAHCPARATRAGLAERETVGARWLANVEPPLWPDGVELWQLAALADAALAPYTALSRAGVGPGDRVVVVGRDARARFAAAIAIAKGATVEEDASAGAIVLAAGPADYARALSLVAPGVTLVLLDGAPALPPLATDWSALVAAEAHVLGAVGGHPDLLPELCALVVRGQLRLGDQVRRVALADAEQAHAAYLADGGALPIAIPA